MSSRKRWHLIFLTMKERGTSKICSIFGAQALPYVCPDFRREAYCAILRSFEDRCCRTFYFGGNGEFEDLCHWFISEMKTAYADQLRIDRVFCVKAEDLLQKQRRALMQKYDDVIYLPPTLDLQEKSSYLRDCAMIDASECVIFCVEEKRNSSAYKAYKYAKSKGKSVVNLWEKYAPVLVPRDVAQRLLHPRSDAFTVN